MVAIYTDFELHQKCRSNFKNHLFYVFKNINLPSPTEIQYDIADVLQYGWEDIIIEGFRGVAKSTITGCYTTWKLDNDPENYQLLEISANQTEACKFLKFTRDLLDIVPYLNYLIPNKNQGQRDSALQFNVAPAITRIQPSCKAIGIFGQVTGNRANEIIADDIETSQNCDTSVKREAIRSAVTEFSPILRPLKGREIYLGTPHTETSIYNEKANKGCRVQIFPVRYPTPQEQLKYGGNLADALVRRLGENPDLIGKPTDPLRFDEETIIKEEAKGRSKFLMQYMLDNTLSDIERYPLKCSDLVVIDCDDEIAPEKVAYGSSPNLIHKDLPCNGIGTDKYYQSIPLEGIKWLPYSFKTMAIDPSGRGQDELAYAIGGVLNSQIFLLKQGGLQGGYNENNLAMLANTAKRYKVNRIVIESNFGDGMFTVLLSAALRKIKYLCEVIEVRSTVQKEKRIIDTLEPVMNQHKLIFNKQVIFDDLESIKIYPSEKQLQYSLTYQMTRLTRDKGCLAHDDRIDCLAMLVNDCLSMLSLDVDEEVKLRQEQELEDLVENFFGYSETDNHSGWFDSL